MKFCSNVPDREHAVALPAQKYLPAILHFGWRAEHLGGELFDVEAGPYSTARVEHCGNRRYKAANTLQKEASATPSPVVAKE